MKPIKCQICKVAPNSDMCFVPFSRFCNDKVEKAEIGSVIDLIETWRKSRVILVRKCKVKVNSGVFTFLLKHIYGDAMTWERMVADWAALCYNEDLQKSSTKAEVFSDKEVLLLEYRPFVKEIYEAEQEAKRREQERREKAFAREKLLQDAKNGIFEHPDIIS